MSTALSNLRILLADDEAFIRRLTANMLKTLGITEVFEAEDGLEAVSCLNARTVDLLVTDIQMPKMNGIDLIKQIRMDMTSADRALRIIAVTSFSYTEVLSSCLLLGVNGFLVKPITAASAKEKILFALNEKVHLPPPETYLQVKTDLEIIETSDEKSRPVAAASPGESAALRASGGLLVSINRLRPGMELMENVYANNGVKLLPKGQQLSEVLIHRITDLKTLLNRDEILVKST